MEIKKIDLDDVQDTKSVPSLSEKKILNNTQPSMSKNNPISIIAIFAVVIVAGFLSGSWLKSFTSTKTTSRNNGIQNIQAEIPASGAKVGDTYGSGDEMTFKDKVLGVIDKGGINGEGTHVLVRPGGKSQTVCLSSTTIDLDLLVGHQTTLWGETFNGQKCGWLMDVGRAKIENLNVPLPD